MNRILFGLAALVGAPASGADAPASLAGKFFHENVAAVTARTSWSRITELRPDGTTLVVKAASGYALNLSAPYIYFVDTRPSGTTFTYQKTGGTTATLIFTEASGAKETYTLDFSSDSAGTITQAVRSPTGRVEDTFGLGITPAAAKFDLTDRAPNSAQYLANISMRGRVAPGQPLIAGFVIPGTMPRDVLIRVVGPSLATFGVTGVWADPDFEIYRGATRVTRQDFHYSDWSSLPPPPFNAANAPNPVAGFRSIFTATGAFDLLDNSKDAAEVPRLDPGAYTIVATAAGNDSGGEALIEVYLLP